jgi:hypothetical protein
VTPSEAEAEAEAWGRARRRPSSEAEAETEAWGRARRSSLLHPRLNSGGGRDLLLSILPWWLAQ